MNHELTFRFAQEQDIDKVFYFITQIAIYQNMTDELVSTPEMLKREMFENKRAEVLFVLEDGVEVGFAVFFHNFSTFRGRPGLYLDDLFIMPEHRGKGYGEAALRELARIAIDRGCARFEWECLDWNENSLNFYKNLGAEAQDYWVIFRTSGEALEQIAYGKK